MLVTFEALFMGLLAIYLLIRSVTSTVVEADALTAEIVFLLLGAVGLFVAGRGFRAKRNFGRGATVMANLIALGVSYYMIDGDRLAWGLILGAISLTTLVAALSAIPAQK